MIEERKERRRAYVGAIELAEFHLVNCRKSGERPVGKAGAASRCRGGGKGGLRITEEKLWEGEGERRHSELVATAERDEDTLLQTRPLHGSAHRISPKRSHREGRKSHVQVLCLSRSGVGPADSMPGGKEGEPSQR